MGSLKFSESFPFISSNKPGSNPSIATLLFPPLQLRKCEQDAKISEKGKLRLTKRFKKVPSFPIKIIRVFEIDWIVAQPTFISD